MDLGKWNIEILNELIKHPEIEGERFDFKEKRMGELAQDICAMANTRRSIGSRDRSRRKEWPSTICEGGVDERQRGRSQ